MLLAMVVAATAGCAGQPTVVPGAAAPVGGVSPILTLTDDQRLAARRPVEPDGFRTYRIALGDRHDLIVEVPRGWKTVRLKAVGDDRLFVDRTGSVTLEVETEEWSEGDAFGWARAAVD
ncbi:MAG: hypothetical protein ACRCYQ_10230, partial [Nocardioides sp.]